MVITGPAGSGKTTLLKEITRVLAEQDTSYQVVAPTGKAARNIQERVGISASTVHSGIYTFVATKKVKGRTRHIFRIRNEQDLPTVLLVDEASMLANTERGSSPFQFGTGHLVNDIIAYMRMHERPNAKIIFIGDRFQLPPVHEEESIAINHLSLWGKYGMPSTSLDLKTVYRQSEGSGVLSLAKDIRKRLELGVRHMDHIDWNNDVQSAGMHDLGKRYADAIQSPDYPEILNSFIVITRSNKAVQQHIEFARERLHSSSAVKPQVGEPLMVYANQLYQGRLFLNGDRLTVASGEVRKVKRVAFLKSGNGSVQYPLNFISLKVNSESGGKPIEILLRDDFLNFESVREDEYQRALYSDFFRRMRKKHNRSRVSLEDPDVFEDYKRDPYINALRIRYGYAVTCHKAQGGEWPEVIIDFEHRNVYYTDDFKWFYTGVTRASEKVEIINHQFA